MGMAVYTVHGAVCGTAADIGGRVCFHGYRLTFHTAQFREVRYPQRGDTDIPLFADDSGIQYAHLSAHRLSGRVYHGTGRFQNTKGDGDAVHFTDVD